MSTGLVEFVKSVEVNVADTVSTVEWFVNVIPVSHRNVLMKIVGRSLCGYRDWIWTGNLPVPEGCQKCGLIFDKLWFSATSLNYYGSLLYRILS
jgi:hypothetical protein